MDADEKQATVINRPSVPVSVTQELLKYAEAATVKISGVPKGGTGFFVRYLRDEGQECKGLMTNHHVVNFDGKFPIRDDSLEFPGATPEPTTIRLSSKKLKAEKGNNYGELVLNQETIGYAFSCSFLDVTLLEFTADAVTKLEADGLNDPQDGVQFLELDASISLPENDQLHIYHHPAKELEFSVGEVLSTPTPWVCYNASTRHGSSGSSLLRIKRTSNNKFSYQLVAIHHSAGRTVLDTTTREYVAKYNCGTAIGEVLKAITIDRIKALGSSNPIEYPLQQKQTPTKEELIYLLFEDDRNAVKEISRVDQCINPKHYNNSPYYVLKCEGGVKITIIPSAHSIRFTLLNVLDSRYTLFPWRVFSVDEFRAFHKVAALLKRNRDNSFLKKLVEQLRLLSRNNLAEYHCVEAESKKVTAVHNLKWCVMSKDGPKNFARALCQTEPVTYAEELTTVLGQYESTDAELVTKATDYLEKCLAGGIFATNVSSLQLSGETASNQQNGIAEGQAANPGRCIIVFGGSVSTIGGPSFDNMVEFYHPTKDKNDINQIGSISKLSQTIKGKKLEWTSGCYLSDSQQILLREYEGIPPMLYGLRDGSVQELPLPYKDSDGLFLPIKASTTAALNGSVCISCGGHDKKNRAFLNECYVFDPAKDLSGWTTVAPMPEKLCASASVVLNADTYVIGGEYGKGESQSAQMFRYSVSANEWSVAPSMPTERSGHAAAVLSPTEFIIGGGRDKESLRRNDCLVFNTELNEWRQVGDLVEYRSSFVMVKFDGLVYALGGCAEQSKAGWHNSTVEVYDPQTENWKKAQKQLKTHRTLCVAVAV